MEVVLNIEFPGHPLDDPAGRVMLCLTRNRPASFSNISDGYSFRRPPFSNDLDFISQRLEPEPENIVPRAQVGRGSGRKCCTGLHVIPQKGMVFVYPLRSLQL